MSPRSRRDAGPQLRRPVRAVHLGPTPVNTQDCRGSSGGVAHPNPTKGKHRVRGPMLVDAGRRDALALWIKPSMLSPPTSFAQSKATSFQFRVPAHTSAPAFSRGISASPSGDQRGTQAGESPGRGHSDHEAIPVVCQSAFTPHAGSSTFRMDVSFQFTNVPASTPTPIARDPLHDDL